MSAKAKGPDVLDEPKYAFFHAFKGGTGRTYAVLNAANLCARDGLNVVVFDLDVEAPGIAQRYDLNPSGPDIEPGFVEYARKILSHQPETPLPLYNVEVQGAGSLQVIPSGDPYSEDYWNVLVSDGWAGMLENDDIGRQFWKLTKSKIAALVPRPDLVLIDGRAGLAELSMSVIRDLEPFVMSFINRAQPESPAGTRVLLTRLVKRTNIEHAIIGLVRRPKMVETAAYIHSDLAARVGTEDDKTWLKDNFGRIAKDTMVLTWDLEIELGGELVVPPIGEIRRSSDYWPDIHKIASHLAPRPISIEVGERVGETARPVKWFLLEGGQMLNMSDRSPNLSFRVDTFRGLLDQLWFAIEASSVKGDGGSSAAGFGEALEVSGFATGQSFGLTFAADVDVRKLSVGKKIERWCDFDSAVGFGLIRYEPSSKAPSKPLGTIVVEQNAFATGRKSSDHDLCLFLVGYISGVLNKLFEMTIEVKHVKCIREGSDACQFDFRVAP